jgi:glycosyltransferase involved in cell wall biosynthesis
MAKMKKNRLFGNKDWNWINSNFLQDDKLPVPIPNGLYLLWAVLWPLQKQFDIETIPGRIGLISWWLLYGKNEFKGIDITVCDLDTLIELAGIEVDQDVWVPITGTMALCWQYRQDLRQAFDLSVREGRLAFMIWWINHGYEVIAPHTLPEVQKKALSEPALDIIQDVEVPITVAMALCWQSRKDLRQAFDHASPDGRKRFVQWWEVYGKKEAGALALWSSPDGAKCDDRRTEKAPSAKHEVANPRGTLIPGGINLIGLAKGELGIGEDLRMAARVLSAAGIDFSVFNFPPSCSSREEDKSVSHLVRDDLVYNINMVNLTGFEHARLLTQIGSGIFDKRYTIGAWPWELPVWPRPSDVVFKLVDELWASTKYAVQAYSNSPTPVIHMPMAVDFDSMPSYRRIDFGLPDEVYLFLFVFDGLSFIARKNPIAHIKAFWEAFPKQRQDVGLVVKTMNVHISNDVWRQFHEMATQDARIRVYAETFSKDKVLGLMNCCDAFVSLHRAEGFGRCIAEMMWLGKPVIATNFSGNTDFTTPDTAFLVDGQLVPVGQDEYIFGGGQMWCDPDVGQAAEHMRRCVEDRALAEKLSNAGRNLIRSNYSTEAVCAKYLARLKKLGFLE